MIWNQPPYRVSLEVSYRVTCGRLSMVTSFLKGKNDGHRKAKPYSSFSLCLHIEAGSGSTSPIVHTHRAHGYPTTVIHSNLLLVANDSSIGFSSFSFIESTHSQPCALIIGFRFVIVLTYPVKRQEIEIGKQTVKCRTFPGCKALLI